MKKYFFIFSVFALLTFAGFNAISVASGSSGEIIAIVNGENLYLSDLNRLFNAQKKKFHNDLNFDLLSVTTSNPQATIKRDIEVKKANKEGFFVTNNEFNKVWEDLLQELGGLEKLESKLKENSLLISDIKEKLEENMLLDKYFEKHNKEKLVEKMIDELIVLQEAKIKNIQVQEEELTKRFNLLKEKLSGGEGLKTFLDEHNATIEDAINEIKKQIIYEKVKNSFVTDGQTDNKNNFKSFITKKKLDSSIVVYLDKLFQETGDKITNLRPALAEEKQETLVPGQELTI